MSIFDQIIGAIAPHNCVNCGMEGKLLCRQCVHNLQPIPSRCYRCRRLTVDSRTCHACRKISRLYRVQVIAMYDGAAKELVQRLKFTGAQAAAREMSDLGNLVCLGNSSVVPVPTATSRVRQRGYDQAKLLARAIAKKHRLPYSNCLVRSGQTHQVGARREQRLKQLSSAFRLKTGTSVQGTNVVLVDDVVTTGATLEAAARCLKANGAKQVEAIVFAQA